MYHKKVTLCFLPAIIVTLMIFFLSSRNSMASNAQSGELTQSLMSFFDPSIASEIGSFDLTTKEDFDQFFATSNMSQINQYLRMFAHMCEFGGLGLMILLGSKLLEFTPKKAFRLTLIWGVIVSFLDELLQAFVPGRTASFFDVCKDMIGICGAILCIILISHIMQRRHQKRSNTYQ